MADHLCKECPVYKECPILSAVFMGQWVNSRAEQIRAGVFSPDAVEHADVQSMLTLLSNATAMSAALEMRGSLITVIMKAIDLPNDAIQNLTMTIGLAIGEQVRGLLAFAYLAALGKVQIPKTIDFETFAVDMDDAKCYSILARMAEDVARDNNS